MIEDDGEVSMAASGRDTNAQRGSWRARAGLLAWCLALVSGTVLFHRLGGGPLAPPPLAPDDWTAWADGRDPLVATVAVLRLVVLGLSWYLVGTTSIGILARALRAARLIRLADALTVPALRRLLQAALGVSLATAMVVSAAAPRADLGVDERSPPDVEVVEATGPHERDGAVTLAADRPSTDQPTDTQPTDTQLTGALAAGQVRLAVADEEPSQVTITGTDDVDAPERSMTRPPGLELLEDGPRSGAGDPAGTDVGGRGSPAAPEGPGSGHTVSAGESFWRIAEDVLAERLERDPTDREVAAYVERLVEHNRDRLADPQNPDLIFPGQRFDLPSLVSEGDA